MVVERALSEYIECCIRGYHVYHHMWNPELGKVSVAVRESHNHHNRYTIAVLLSVQCRALSYLRSSSFGALIGGSTNSFQRIGIAASAFEKKDRSAAGTGY